MSIVERKAHRTTFRVGELEATIGGNESDPPGLEWRYKEPYLEEPILTHRPGSNGLWSLSSIHRPGNVFLPKVAGLNYEFLFDGELEDDLRRYAFDPRACPVELSVVDDRTVRFHQPPTFYRGLESWWQIQLVAPHYVDLTFESSPTRPFPHGWYTVFWASYIAHPTNRWMRFVTPDGKLTERPRESDPNTTVPAGSRALLTRPDWKEDWLRRDESFTFAAPYFVGIQAHMLYQVMVETDHLLGFASPVHHPDQPNDHVPWNFHVTCFDVEPGGRYGFRARLVYAPWEGETQPGREYERWLDYLSRRPRRSGQGV